MNIDEKTAYIKDIAIKNIGFDAIGISPAEEVGDDAARLEKWLADGYNADMGYMARNVEKRLDPRLLVDGAKSIISVLVSYNRPTGQLDGRPKVAQYAHSADYHQTVKDMLYRLLDEVRKLWPEASGRAFVDSAPVLERSWAVRAGLGWIGRSSMLINERLGSFTFIGELIVSEVMAYDKPYAENHCGRCRRCVNTCPTLAITDSGVDARRCIAYQTIENQGEIPAEIRGRLENRLFGCDICMEVCPWNRVAEYGQSIVPILGIDGVDWQTITDEEFCEKFGHTPMARAGLPKIRQTLGYLNVIK